MASAGSAEKQFDRRERANGSRKKRAFKSNIFLVRSRLFQRYVVESIFKKQKKRLRRARATFLSFLRARALA